MTVSGKSFLLSHGFAYVEQMPRMPSTENSGILINLPNLEHGNFH